MVHSSSANVVRAASGDGVDCSERSFNPPVGSQNAQPAGSSQFDGMSCVRQFYREQGFSEHVTDVLLSSWRPATQKQYAVYFKNWAVFCSSRQIAPCSPNLTAVLEFLHGLLRMSYSTLNSARSALSCFVSLDGLPVGQHPVVCRFLKGAFQQKPPSKTLHGIWDVNQVLRFLKTFTPNSSLTLKELTHKLATLLALVTIQRKQTLLQLDISDEYLKKSSNEYVFVLCKHVKQSRPNYPVPPVVIPRYTADTDICPFLCLEHYIARTETLRHDSALFISTVKPHNAVGTQTMSRWIKTVLQWSGIDMDLFKPHSTRHASSTAAFNASVPLDEILKKAGWSSATTFKRFYLKHVMDANSEC